MIASSSATFFASRYFRRRCSANAAYSSSALSSYSNLFLAAISLVFGFGLKTPATDLRFVYTKKTGL
jgi:hypothetical protein